MIADDEIHRLIRGLAEEIAALRACIWTEEHHQNFLDLLGNLQANVRATAEAGLVLEGRVRALETAVGLPPPKCEHYWIQSLSENRTITNRCQKCGLIEYLKQP